jgi:iron complex transport system substrate-binding protein
MALLAGSGDSKTDDAGPNESEAWTFTDDLGTTIELDEAPDTTGVQSVIAGGLWEYGIVADGVFGPLRRADGSADPSLGLADPTTSRRSGRSTARSTSRRWPRCSRT